MPKTISLLKPDIREGYMRNNSDTNERYRMLHISSELGRSVLDSDIAAGAVQYKACAEYLDADTKPRFVIIECDTEEEGLNAVTYIRSADAFCCTAEDDYSEDLDWYDYDNNLPIVSMDEILSFEKESDEKSNMQYAFRMEMKKDKIPPYWTDYCGDICITDECCVDDYGNMALINHDYNLCMDPFADKEKNKWHSYFERFMQDDTGTIYYIISRNTKLSKLFDEAKDEEGDDSEMIFGFKQNFDEDFSLCALVLKYTAEMIVINAKPSQKEKYYSKLFKCWLKSYGLGLEKQFPMKKLLRNICIMEDSPSQTMDKILKYINYKYPKSSVLSKDLFYQTGVLKNVLETEEKKHEKGSVLSMDDLVGMEDVKKQFENIIETIKFSKERQRKGLPVLEYRNVFLLIGAPGTAKTSMANILGRMMKKEKLLGGTRFGSFSGAQLKAQYVGHTAPKVHSIFEDHDIIIIDEAYSLTASNRGELDIFSQEALAQLAIELENHGTDRLVFFAGYGGDDVSGVNNKMKEFLDANPGIKSRINGTIVFPSYDVSQMLEIVKGIAGRYGYEFEDGALNALSGYFSERIHDENFGNGREARSFVDNCQMTMASRLMRIPASRQTKRMMQLITKEDVENTVKRLSSADTSQEGRKRKITYGFI